MIHGYTMATSGRYRIFRVNRRMHDFLQYVPNNSILHFHLLKKKYTLAKEALIVSLISYFTNNYVKTRN